MNPEKPDVFIDSNTVQDNSHVLPMLQLICARLLKEIDATPRESHSATWVLETLDRLIESDSMSATPPATKPYLRKFVRDLRKLYQHQDSSHP